MHLKHLFLIQHVALSPEYSCTVIAGIYLLISNLILRYMVTHMMPGFASWFAQIYNGELALQQLNRVYYINRYKQCNLIS